MERKRKEGGIQRWAFYNIYYASENRTRPSGGKSEVVIREKSEGEGVRGSFVMTRSSSLRKPERGGNQIWADLPKTVVTKKKEKLPHPSPTIPPPEIPLLSGILLSLL